MGKNEQKCLEAAALRYSIVRVFVSTVNFFAEAVRLQSVNRVTVDHVAVVGYFVGVIFT